MKLTMLLPPAPDDSWRLALQAGVRFAVTKAASQLSGLPAPDDRDALAEVQQRFADHGLTLVGLEGDQFDMSRIKLGLDGRDEDFDRYQAMLTNLGELGIDLLCYNFMLRAPRQTHDWSRTRIDLPVRGGALTTAFALDELPDDAGADAPIVADGVWENYAAFVRAVMPAAEQAGVRLALHPDDPPIPELLGVGRLFHEVEAFERAYALAPSPSNVVTFCQANFILMPGDVTDHARRLADRIAFVHWRDVAGEATRFHETFHDDGPHDMVAMVRLYHDLGFTGPIRLDHAPLMHGEPTPWMPGYGTLGRTHAAAYLRGICQASAIELE